MRDSAFKRPIERKKLRVERYQQVRKKHSQQWPVLCKVKRKDLLRSKFRKMFIPLKSFHHPSFEALPAAQMVEQQWTDASKRLSRLLRNSKKYFGSEAREDGSVSMESLLRYCQGWSQEHVVHLVKKSYKKGQPRFQMLTDAEEGTVCVRAYTQNQPGAKRRWEGNSEAHMTTREQARTMSKALSKMLRHERSRFSRIHEGGFVFLCELVRALRQGSPHWSEDLVKHIVQTSIRHDGRPRYQLTESNGEDLVRVLDAGYWPSEQGADSQDADVQAADGQDADSRDADSHVCCICYFQAKTHALIPCGHMCLCESCAAMLPPSSSRCPMCRKEIQQVVRIFS